VIARTLDLERVNHKEGRTESGVKELGRPMEISLKIQPVNKCRVLK
jgi:hypothetical protein